jgi:hypothetical protein
MDRTSLFYWFRATLAVIGAFVVCGLLGAFATGWLHLWETPITGCIAAFGVVMSAYLFAPSYRLTSALVAFAVGAAAAWKLIGHEDFPESYGPLAYQPTHIPFIATLGGGIAALALACALRWHQARKLGA